MSPQARSSFARGMIVILLVAFGVRVAYVAIAKRGPCDIKVAGKVVGTYPSQCTVGDQIFYNAEANTIADGRCQRPCSCRRCVLTRVAEDGGKRQSRTLPEATCSGPRKGIPDPRQKTASGKIPRSDPQ